MGIKVITPVTSPVIPLADVRLHLRLDLLGGSTHPDDALITAFIDAARDYVEHNTQRSVGVQTLELALDAFPSGAIELPLGAASITSLSYVDDEEAVIVMDSSEYVLDEYSHQSWVLFVDAWPTAKDSANVVKIRYVTKSAINSAVKAAMLLLIGHWYENREASNFDKLQSIPLGVKSLLDTERVYN